MKYYLSIILSFFALQLTAQQYNIIRQGICWTTPGAVDSSLTRLSYVSMSGAGPISINYINAAGDDVDVSGGGSFEMGYCGCCDGGGGIFPHFTPIPFLSARPGETMTQQKGKT